jgi:hypothetical protein
VHLKKRKGMLFFQPTFLKQLFYFFELFGIPSANLPRVSKSSPKSANIA